jgi:pSer/pThr/pTyr-binding forkhead associated (FHA) protein
MIDAKLRVVGGPFFGQTIQLPRGKLLIGRAEDCDVRPNSEFVSGYHCVLLLDDFTLRIRDLGSKNGTIVNGHRVGTSAVILLQDDLIAIGDMNILVDFAPARAEVDSADSTNRLPTALEGTGIFEGDTLEAEIPRAIQPPASRPPVDPNAVSPSTEPTP